MEQFEQAPASLSALAPQKCLKVKRGHFPAEGRGTAWGWILWMWHLGTWMVVGLAVLGARLGLMVSEHFFNQNDFMFLCAAGLQGEKQAWN